MPTVTVTRHKLPRRVRRAGVRVTRTRRTGARLGYVLYRGPSAIDGAPIVVILTGYVAARKHARAGTLDGANSKTGAMLQMYIIRSDVHPLEAIARGYDKSICGACPHRGVLDRAIGRWVRRTCYVEVGKGAANVYRTFHAGQYVDVSHLTAREMAALLEGFGVRFGAYGDPAAIPERTGIVPAIHAVAPYTTGYTHQWRNRIGAHLRGLVMASCDTPEDREMARAANWGTFTVLPLPSEANPDPYDIGAFPCPASKEMGKLATCADCKGCSGESAADFAIYAHGFGATRYTGRRALPVLA